MTTHATADATRRYAARFAASAAAGHYREPIGCGTPDEAAPLLSSIGIGTYLGEPDSPTDAAYTDAIVGAFEGGINVVDTAINYRFQRSERAIGAALRNLAARGFSREEIVLCTKGGFLTPDGVMPEDVDSYFSREYVDPGILDPAQISGGCHCMDPKFLNDQLDRSLKNLGVDCVDIYYLHNPETQLDDVPRDEFARRLRAAFAWLESTCASGKIHYYGMATWNGFRQPPEAKDFLSLTQIEGLAREAAGGPHHFRFVQLPFNLAMTEALTRPNQPLDGGTTTMIEAAEAFGISIMASASLLQGKMAKGLPKFIRDTLGLTNDAERSLQFVRSAPCIKTALVGMSSVAHVRANLRVIGEPLATAEQFSGLFVKGGKT
jgi:aryl-alcohol dehydrogenase-like predicted oxidoreductase